MVPINDRPDRLVRESELARLETVLGDLALDQELASDLELVVLGVTRQADDLHPIAQRRRNRVELIGCGDEEHLRKVERHHQVVVGEGAILGGVEHLEQRRGWIALETGRELVDLVQHDHRVVRASPPERLDDPARQSADVGAAVAADL
jgi:hypothetical protein